MTDNTNSSVTSTKKARLVDDGLLGNDFWGTPLRVMCGVADHLSPDEQAMLQAAYSRNPKSILTRLPKTPEDEAKLKERLREIYVGWNHKSVGQLGSTTMWFEGISQLAAKAIEDTQLFNGQECSTRYIDFTHQTMVHFGDEEFIGRWQEKWRALYIKALPLTIEKLRVEYPFVVDYDPNDERGVAGYQEAYNKQYPIWDKTIKAQAFDRVRALLPAGVTTNVAFTGTFDTMNDKFGAMLLHPSQEMWILGRLALNDLQRVYPDATPGADELYKQNSYMEFGRDYFYEYDSYFTLDGNQPQAEMVNHLTPLFDVRPCPKLEEFLVQRTRGTKLPRALSSGRRFVMHGMMDFASFRDLQRHRPGVCFMPLLTLSYGFNEWYLKQLPPEIVQEAVKLWADQRVEVADSMAGMTDHETLEVRFQYMIPMGMNVPVYYECDLNQFLYMAELRTGKTVHQTLRKFMLDQVADYERIMFGPDKVGCSPGLFVDRSEDNWTLKRGTQSTNEVVEGTTVQAFPLNGK